MNNLVFNSTASQLKTQIYGTNGSTATAIAVDANGNVKTLLYALNGTNAANLTTDGSGNLNVAISNSTSIATQCIFTSISAALTVGSATGTILANTDISLYKNASLFLYNTGGTGAGALTVTLYTSPLSTASYYLAEPTLQPIVVAENSGQSMIIPNAAHYIQLLAQGSSTGSAILAYLNAQT